MIVSLEAIFLSTFVTISQNRANAKRQVLADQRWRAVQEEDDQNKQLLSLTRQILALTQEDRVMENGKRCKRRQLSPDEKWEVFPEVTSQEISQADPRLGSGASMSA